MGANCRVFLFPVHAAEPIFGVREVERLSPSVTAFSGMPPGRFPLLRFRPPKETSSEMNPLRTFIVRAALLSVFGLAFGPACSKGDLGAPCNHGDIVPPQSNALVSFPITDCNENLCLYTTVSEPKTESCNSDDDCAIPGAAEQNFKCTNGSCVVKPEYALRNSMCSRHCNSDADCQDQTFNKVTYDDTLCKGKDFACAFVQKTGPLCCTKLCVCASQKDDALSNEIEMDCNSNPEVKANCINVDN
jgi:hypothetical protein